MDAQLRDILFRVQKPGRYTGGETNMEKVRPSPGGVSVVLSYPDVYEVGMSYLGIRILYHLLNRMDGVACERVFAPWGDMERELRAAGRRLYSLESRTGLHDFDIAGFSLSYELTYTNVLNILDLGGIPLFSGERKDSDPLVIAGGACCFNPEPMSRFIDVFFIGDAEETLPAFVELFREMKRAGVPRAEKLRRISRLEGVYVPALYRDTYEGGSFRGLVPVEERVPPRVEKARVDGLDDAFYPEKQIVPLIRVVHDRIAVEIMRGCPNACRFCQASVINGPVRLRSVRRIRDICRGTYEKTGYDTVALLSLSSVNYPFLSELVEDLSREFRDEAVAISIPSLRIDESFFGLPGMIAAIRKTSLTFAPETAVRSTAGSINKALDLNILCRSASLAYREGWDKIKLYFMVGFPGSGGEETRSMLELARTLSSLRKKVSRRPAEVRLSVNPFIPKPHTPFQWLGMRDEAVLLSRREELLRARSRRVKVDFHDIGRSFLEGALSRGDRRMGSVVYSAWRKGCRMDSWSDVFQMSLWEEAFRENGMDMRREAAKNLSPGAPLAWSHISTGVPEERLAAELKRSGFPDAAD